MLNLILFGGFQLIYDGEMVENPGGDTGRALLSYLAVEADRPHTRQELVAILWPEVTDKEARNRLRVTLSRLRSSLEAIEQLHGVDVLQVDREQIQINPEANLKVDARVFNELLNESERHAHRSVAACYICRGRLEEAISLHQGGFLQGVSLSDSAPFDEWTSLNQERYQRLVVGALEVLVDYHLRRGDFSLAMGYARQQLKLEPWRENAHRQLMNALALSGDRAAALAQYQICQQIMLEQFNAEVSPETITLHERIKSSELGTGRMKRTHNLPAPATPLVGRQEEMAQILQWLADPATRLITISGPGGVGKTRLAVEAVWEVLGAFRHGTWWVSLAGIVAPPEPEQAFPNPLVSALATALDAEFSLKGDLETQLRRYLRDRDLLLILDDFEHLVEYCSPWLNVVLREAPQLVVLVTSRRRTNLRGEWVLSLSGLPVLPDSMVIEEGSEITPAVQLFYERAAQAGRRLTRDKTTRALVTKLCILLQGLPLGVELAAAWTPVMSLSDISRAIEHDLDFLSGKNAGLTVRHRSLRAVFNSSWERLSEREKRALASISIFQGQFDRSAAEQVASVGLEDIMALEERSLLQVSSDGLMSLHARLRGFAAEQSVNFSDMNDLPARHASYYMGRLAEKRQDLYGRAPRGAIAIIQAEWDELRSAWMWAVRATELRLIGDGLASLSRFARLSGWTFEVARLIQQTEASLVNKPYGMEAPFIQLRIELLLTEAEVIRQRGNYAQSLQLCERASELTERIDDRTIKTWADCMISELYIDLGKLDAANLKLLELTSLPDLTPGLSARMRFIEGSKALKLGDLEKAEKDYRHALAYYRDVGDSVMELLITNSLCNVNYFRGEHIEVLDLAQDHLELARDLGDRYGEANALTNLGLNFLELGDLRQARPYIDAALALSIEIADTQKEAENLVLLGRFWQLQGDLGNAHQYLDDAVITYQSIGMLYEQMETILLQGEVFLQAGYYQAAQEKLQIALEYFREGGGRGQADRAEAGLAKYALIDRRNNEAMQLVEGLLPRLEQDGIPIMVYLTCYQVLESIGDQRANEVIELARRLLVSRADKIDDIDLRKSYLENIPVHRQVFEEFHSRGSNQAEL